MRFLADENFPGDAVTALRTLGHDVLWIRTDAPGITLPASCGIVLFRVIGYVTLADEFDTRNAIAAAKEAFGTPAPKG